VIFENTPDRRPSPGRTETPVLAAPPPLKPQKLEPVAEQPAGQGGGWVQDLLRRASREETATTTVAPAPARTASTETIASLSSDIAHAVDHDVAVDAWNRYLAGERNVFSRSLYNQKGQHTFEEIHRKYQEDRKFSTAVDRYCADFEKLIKDAERNGKGSALAQGYLTSDTGKIYTMLAHAAGRLK